MAVPNAAYLEEVFAGLDGLSSFWNDAAKLRKWLDYMALQLCAWTGQVDYTVDGEHYSFSGSQKALLALVDRVEKRLAELEPPVELREVLIG